MKKVKTIVLIAIIIASFNSCQKTDFKETLMNEKESELLSISEAKLWLEAKHPGGLIMKSGDKSQKKYYLTKKWSEAKKFENDKVEVVEVPLGAEEMIGFITAETEELVRNTGIIKYASSETRLIIRKFKKTGLVTAHFMTITGAPEYLEITDFKVDKNSMLKKEKDFSGIVLFHELNGLFNVGWKYSDGKLTHKITSDKVIQTGLRLKVASAQCYSTDIYETITYYHLEFGLEVIDYIETNYIGSYTFCVDGTGVDDGEAGGAGEPESSELSCSCNICPGCGGCLPELILKQAVIPDDDGTSGTTTTTTMVNCPPCSCPEVITTPEFEDNPCLEDILLTLMEGTDIDLKNLVINPNLTASILSVFDQSCPKRLITKD